MTHQRSGLGKVAVISLLATSCLVNDPRPPPGSVHFTASSDAALQNGFTTADGWTVSYDRFLASLGNASPEGDACTFYSDAAYDRVLDMRRSEPQRVSVIHALGQCEIDFEVSSPWSDSVLGDGVSAADRDFMRTPASDDETTDAAISIFVSGRAERNGIAKRFHWAFRKRIDFANCYQVIDGQRVYGADFRQNESLTRDLTVHGSALFQDHLDPSTATLAFGPFADADDVTGDGDGDVTLAELGQVPISGIATPGYTDAEPEWTTLEHYVYRGLFTRIVRYQGTGDCEEAVVSANDRALH